MKSFTQIQQETSTVQLEFLLTDIATANIFLDVAGTTRDADTRTRNVEHANEAHTAVRRLSGRVHMSPEQAADVQHRLELLKRRIDAVQLPQT